MHILHQVKLRRQRFQSPVIGTAMDFLHRRSYLMHTEVSMLQAKNEQNVDMIYKKCSCSYSLVRYDEIDSIEKSVLCRLSADALDSSECRKTLNSHQALPVLRLHLVQSATGSGRHRFRVHLRLPHVDYHYHLRPRIGMCN